MLKKLRLPYAEFYITNSCNFNCTGCNRFNNYSFSGSQYWTDYQQQYLAWSKILEIDEWTILGGEPMMNPTYLDWLANISRLWPEARGSFLTNGYFLKPDNKELYNIFKSSAGKIQLNIGLHNIARSEQVLSTVKLWLHGKIVVEPYPKDLKSLPNFDQNWKTTYNSIKDMAWPNCDSVDDWEFLPDHIKHECREVFSFSPEQLSETRLGWKLIDENDVTVIIQPEDYFHQGALIVNSNKNFKLHDSDPLKAHSICHSKKCHHFDKGQLFKCGQVALFKEIDQEFYLELSATDRDLVYGYTPANSAQDWETLETFINNIEHPIPQCKFCPEQYQIKQIFATHGQKIKMIRKKKDKHSSAF